MKLLVLVVLGAFSATAAAQESWWLEEEYRVDPEEADPPISVFKWVVPLDSGRTLVLSHPFDHAIRFLDARTGQTVTVSGRQGFGPGEFTRAGQVAYGGTAW